MIYDNSDKKADLRMEQLLETIQNKDHDTLKEMFSKRVLDEVNDFDSSVEYLFGLIQGNVESWERDRFGSDGSIENGKKSTRLRSWYTVTTNKGKYMFFIIDFTIDTIDPDNAGLYMIRAIRAEDEETQFAGTWQDMEIPGIYKPEN